jgi:hypothetical protein
MVTKPRSCARDFPPQWQLGLYVLSMLALSGKVISAEVNGSKGEIATSE